MNKQQLSSSRLYITALVSVLIWALLLWEHFNGGVPSHSILARADMPSISNWWGALFLPVLTWFLLGRINKRISDSENGSTSFYPPKIVAGFGGSLIFGILLAAFFSNGLGYISSFMFRGVLVLALFLPIYRAEYVLGFILGLTYSFGAILPTGFASIVALISALIFNYVRPVFVWIGRWFINKWMPTG